MKKFLIKASETVFYEAEVEADSEDEARSKIYEGEIDIEEGRTNSANFEIDSCEEIK